MQWKPCASKRRGCKKLVVDWNRSPGRTLIFAEPEPVKWVRGKAYMRYTRLYGQGADLRYAIGIVEPLDESPILAVGVDFTRPKPCNLSPDVGEWGLVVSGEHQSYPQERIVSGSTWSAPNEWLTARVSYSSLGLSKNGGTQRLAVGDARFFFEVKNPSSIALFDPKTKRVILGRPIPPTAEVPIPVTGGAFATDVTPPYGLFFIANDGTYIDVIRPAPPHIPTWRTVDRSHGDALVWVESDRVEGVYDNSVIWTSPYGRTPAAMKPRRVAVLANSLHSGGSAMVANRGVALNLTGNTTALITRLSDGMSWTVKAEPGDGFTAPLWVDDHEVWLSTADLKVPQFHGYTSSIVRIRRNSLGEPNVRPGAKRE